MNNVIQFRPRQTYRMRRGSYFAAAGTTGGACGYWALVSLWPDVFFDWLSGLLVVCAVLVTTSVAAGFYAQKVRQRREDERRLRERLREWRETQARLQRHVRAQEAARLRRAMEAPTQVITLLPPRPEAYVAMEDRLRIHLLSQLTEHTGDLTQYERPTPPRSGAA